MTKSSSDMVGRILNNRYELTEKIGEGGMALAWQARDLLLGRPVAVKIMRESLSASPQFIGRFRREAQAAASLSQEHIAAVHDFGNDGGLHYIVMEYVPGEDLRQRLKRAGPLSPREAVAIAIDIAEALEAAHAHGLIHRDIKPANILLSEKGTLKVTDFGIARALSGEDTGTDSLLGSVHYLSPEQARGDAVGPQADIYSLGAVLFEMLTGRPPFSAANPVAVVHKHLYDTPPGLRSLRPECSPELEAIVLRCLDKSLNNRYATAGELLNYLRSLQACLLEGEGGAPSGGAFPRILSKGRIKWRRWALGAGLSLVAAALLFFWSRGGFSKAAPESMAVPPLVGMDIASAQAVADDLGFILYEGTPLYSVETPKGKIARQLPAAGEVIPRGERVEVQASLGEELVKVPAVTEMTEAQARGWLEEAGLRVGQVREEINPTLPKGQVVVTEPPAGNEVPRDSKITLVVSEGGPVVAPDGKGVSNPPTPPQEQTVTFTLPRSSHRAEIIVEALESETHRVRVLFRGELDPGEAIPPQKLPALRPLTVRIKVNGQVVEERSFES